MSSVSSSALHTGGHCGRKWVFCQCRHTTFFWSVFQRPAYLTSLDPPFQFDLIQGRAGLCNYIVCSTNVAYKHMYTAISCVYSEILANFHSQSGNNGLQPRLHVKLIHSLQEYAQWSQILANVGGRLCQLAI